MQPSQIEQNSEGAILRYPQLTFNSANLTSAGLFDVTANYVACIGDNVISIPEIGGTVKKTLVQFNPKLFVTITNAIAGTSTLYSSPLDFISFLGDASDSIQYDGTGTISDIYTGQAAKEFFRKISTIQFNTGLRLVVNYSIPMANFLSDPAFGVRIVGPIVIFLRLHPVIRLVF